MVVQVAQNSALRAWPLNANGMIQKYVNLTLFQFQFHTFNKPRIGDTKNLFIQLAVLNGSTLLGALPVQLNSAWAEDRAMLGSIPRADSGTKTEAGCQHVTPFHYPSLRIGTKAINPGGMGAGPHSYSHLEPGIPIKMATPSCYSFVTSTCDLDGRIESASGHFSFSFSDR